MKLDLVLQSKYVIQPLKEDYCKIKMTITEHFAYAGKLPYMNHWTNKNLFKVFDILFILFNICFLNMIVQKCNQEESLSIRWE